MQRFLIPLAVFVVLVGFLAVGLRLNPREVPFAADQQAGAAVRAAATGASRAKKFFPAT